MYSQCILHPARQSGVAAYGLPSKDKAVTAVGGLCICKLVELLREFSTRDAAYASMFESQESKKVSLQ